MIKNLSANARDERSIFTLAGSGMSHGEGNDNPLQCSCLENSMDRGTWRATVYGVTELDVIECTHTHIQVTPFSICLFVFGLFSFQECSSFISILSQMADFSSLKKNKFH